MNTSNQTATALYTDHALVSLPFRNYDSAVINQAVDIIDSNKIGSDSEYHIQGIYYKWHVLPDSGCDSVVNPDYYVGLEIIFHCAGDYKIYASIYDSSTNIIEGGTDTVTVHVINDTLVQYTPFMPGDNITIHCAEIENYPYGSDSDYLIFKAITSDSYNVFTNAIINYTDTSTASDFTMFFTGVQVANYPFIDDKERFNGTIRSGITIPYFATDDSVKTLHINYMGTTYSGYIQRTDAAYIVHWDYSTGVYFDNNTLLR